MDPSQALSKRDCMLQNGTCSYSTRSTFRTHSTPLNCSTLHSTHQVTELIDGQLEPMLVLVQVVHLHVLLVGLKDLHTSQLFFLTGVLLVVPGLELLPSHVAPIVKLNRQGISSHCDNKDHDQLHLEEVWRGIGIGRGELGGEHVAWCWVCYQVNVHRAEGLWSMVQVDLLRIVSTY